MTPRYVKDGDAEIILLGARDDPPQNNPVYLKDVAEFSKALNATGVDYSQRGMAFDSVEAQGYPLGSGTSPGSSTSCWQPCALG